MVKTLKQIAFEFKLKLGYSTAFVLLLLSYFLTLYGNKQLIKQMVWLNQTNGTINNLETLTSAVKEAQIGVSGYIGSRDTGFLLLYRTSKTVVTDVVSNLQAEAVDTSLLKSRLAILRVMIIEKFTQLDLFIKDYTRANSRFSDSIPEGLYASSANMDGIRTEIQNLKQYQKKQLNNKSLELETKYKKLNFIIAISLTLALIFALFGFITHRREYRGRLLSEKKVNDYQQELQQRIIELGKANKELILMKRSEKFAATGRLARTIAHEVRNPLTNIDLAVSQILTDGMIENGNKLILLDIVERNSKRINQLISELLNATRFAELIYSDVSVNNLMNETLILANDRIELNQITIKKKFSPGISNILADAEKIKIAFLNLIVNAIEAMEPGKGVLEIQTKEEENKCIVEISDNGYGMTEDQLTHLFEPYFTTKTAGNGLGLTNTQNIILNHRGSISVNSMPGLGTTFIIKFELPGPVGLRENIPIATSKDKNQPG